MAFVGNSFDMENKQQNYMSTLYQNARMGMQSIHDVLPKVKNAELKKILKRQYDDYETVAEKLEKLAKQKQIEIKDNNWFEKMRLLISTKMSTFFDDSTRNIVTMFLLGTTMGLVQLLKDFTDYHGTDEEFDKLRDKLEEIQQNNYNELRDFLKKQ